MGQLRKTDSENYMLTFCECQEHLSKRIKHNIKISGSNRSDVGTQFMHYFKVRLCHAHHLRDCCDFFPDFIALGGTTVCCTQFEELERMSLVGTPIFHQSMSVILQFSIEA